MSLSLYKSQLQPSNESFCSVDENTLLYTFILYIYKYMEFSNETDLLKEKIPPHTHTL